MIVAIVLMMLATQVSRLAPVFFLSNFNPSDRFRSWLQHLAIGVLGALVLPEFFKGVAPGQTFPDLNPVFLFGGVLCLAVGLRTRNLLFTIFVGVVSVALIRYFGGE